MKKYIVNKTTLRKVKVFSLLFFHRARHDKLTTIAGSLSYTTILSSIPVITVIFFLFSLFPSFDEFSQKIKKFFLYNLLPTANEAIQENIDIFLDNATKMTLLGSIFLVITSLMVVNSIDIAINSIWRIKIKRPIIHSFAIYWTVLTLGPIAMLISLALSSYIKSINPFHIESFIDKYVITILPFILSFLCFTLLYSVVPNIRVHIKYSIMGAFVASILLEIAKKGFSIYLTMVKSYELIYGLLSVFPITFLWIYIIWMIVLIGAEFAATLSFLDTEYTDN